MNSNATSRTLVIQALKTNLGITKLDDQVIDRLADRYETELGKYRERALRKSVSARAVAKASSSV